MEVAAFFFSVLKWSTSKFSVGLFLFSCFISQLAWKLTFPPYQIPEIALQIGYLFCVIFSTMLHNFADSNSTFLKPALPAPIVFASLHNFITIPHVSSYAAWLSPPSNVDTSGWSSWVPLSSLCWLATRLDIPILTLWRVALPLATFWRSPWPLPPVLQFHPFSTACIFPPSHLSHHHVITSVSSPGGFPCPHSLPPVTCQFSSVLSVSHMSYLFTAYSHLLLSLGQAYQILTWFSAAALASCLQFHLHPRPMRYGMLCHIFSPG